jgi:alpha-ketoglutarate-dependent taurine dioxygenase
MDDRNRTLWALAALAWAAAERGERERAASLWATVENEKRDPGRFAKFAPDLYRPKIPDVVQLGAAPSLEDAVRLGLDSLD